MSLGAVSQGMAAVLDRLRRRGLDPSQQRRPAQMAGVHLREKSWVGQPLVDQSSVDELAADPNLAVGVDLALGSTLPSEALVDLPTVVLLDRTHHHNRHHLQFAMFLRLARIHHILHNYVEPREWAL